MGFLNSFFDKSSKADKDLEFIKIVKASDHGEEWAKEKIRNMWNEQDPTLCSRIDKARVEIYSDAAQKGDEHAQYMLGISLISTDFNEAKKWLNPLIAKGNTEAMKAIGDQYTKYGCFGENEAEWLKWYLQAAEEGDADAQARIALQYSVMGDKSKASYWYEQAAYQGNSDGLAGVADNKKELLMSRLIKPQNESVEEWSEKNDKLHYEAEENYLDALNAAETNERYSVICYSLAGLYELCGDVYVEDRERSAYFYYESYLSGKNEYALHKFKKIVEKYHLDVDTSDIQKWAQKLHLIEK